ncbi:MAG: TIGR03986 family CRISPR-associated RAMP protein [Lachnospiraceae bacterium]|nr:TIGR03986 family CRISPR-associated RAMP protein [Lachnospiraceae bacterium]
MIGSEALYSGYITYRMTAQTPLMIDDGHGSFYRSADGSYAIPGSTIRGLIRNHVQILSFADVSKDMDDYYLMYRAVAGGCQKDDYAQVLGAGTKDINGRQMSILKNVKAGYIKREGKKYYLYQNIGDSDGTFQPGDTDYYVVSERYVLERARKEFAYILRDNGRHLQNFPPFRETRDRNNKLQYIGRENKQYVPYYEEITYSTANGKVSGIAKNELKRTGTVLSSGFIGKKKAFYVIPEADLSSRKEIPEESIQSFQADYNRRKNGIKKEAQAFFDLPAEGELRPAFYIELEGRLYIGYTPRLRLMYRYSILNGQTQKNRPACDYAEALFGYVTEDKAYKSRVFFTEARLTNDKTCRPQDEDVLILAEPKPTSYLEYLKQTDGQKVRTYNDRDFELRGVKQYWLQKIVQKNPEGASTNEKIYSKIAPIETGSEFEGTIRFRNLTEAELGLLLWSIRLEKDSQINLGKAKAYGYGRACVDQTTLYLQNSQKAYDLAGGIFGTDPFEQQTDEKRDAFVEAWQKALAGWLGGGTNRTEQPVRTDREVIMANPSIRDFFGMKSVIKEGRDVTYMTLEEFKQYKQKNNPLPEAKAYIGRRS